MNEVCDGINTDAATNIQSYLFNIKSTFSVNEVCSIRIPFTATKKPLHKEAAHYYFGNKTIASLTVC